MAREGLGASISFGTSTITFDNITLSGLGIEGGDAIESTLLSHLSVRTKKARELYEVPDLTFTGDMDSISFTQLKNAVNVNQQITFTFPSDCETNTVVFWGYLKNFTSGEAAEGERWTGTGTIVATLQDNSRNEVEPTVT